MKKILVGVILGLLLFTSGCTQKHNNMNMLNPASKYCVENGGELKIITENGGQVGYCYLKDGRVCGEWSFYNNHCKMPMEEAYKLAKNSSKCNTDELKLQNESGTYNKNTYTWWFNLKYSGDKPCNPACVVYENGSVDVNWRCTGLNE